MKTATNPLQTHLAQILLATAALLLVPLVAMQFSSDVRWSVEDFVVAGVLLIATGLVLDLIIRRIHSRNRKTMALGALAIVFVYIWAELAVGVFTHLGS